MMGRMQRSFVLKSARGWDGVEPEGYVPDAPATKVVRHTLVGGRRLDSQAPGPQLEVRYFEVPPGAVTRLEKHEHEHYVIVGEGQAHAIVGASVSLVGPRDVVYIGPLEPHQFVNRGAETFGFFCTVDSVRDVSQTLDPEEIARLAATPAGDFIDPYGAPPPRAAVKL